MTECPGYTRIEESKKTFYRYIKNDYVIVNADGEILEDESECGKSFCMIEYLKYEDDDRPNEPTPNIIKITNPKTYDGVDKSILMSIISFSILILVLFKKKIFLVLSNLFKSKFKKIIIKT